MLSTFPWLTFGMTTQCESQPAPETVLPDVQAEPAVAETIAWTTNPLTIVPTKTITALYQGFSIAIRMMIAP